MLDRREFLTLASGIAVAAPRRRRASALVRPVVVIGAGMAGLRAMERLVAAGAPVLGLEGRRRPGGRVLTLREPFAEGLDGEAGPIRIATQHRRVLSIVEHHGLPLIPFASGSGAELAVVRGLRVGDTDLDRLSDVLELTPEERGLSQGELLEKYVGEVPFTLRDPGITGDSTWAMYDRTTWPEWLRSRGASPGAVALMTLGGDSRELSALYILRQYAMLAEGGLYKIDGGMDLLPRAMARALPDFIRYDARVTRLDPQRDGVAVHYTEGGARRTVLARAVIVTVAASVLRRIATSSPTLSSEFALWASISYFPATRMLVETTDRSWHDDDLSGSARTDRPAEIWDAAYEAEGEGGLLGATVGGELGRAFANAPRATAVRAAVDVMHDAFPRVRAKRATAYRWAADEWNNGAFAAFRPGEMMRIIPAVARNGVERVFFAGEHTAVWTGWMEGALESADRAVGEALR